jgi:peptidoglycan/LPS O-acetylase OafA/YrhL
MSAPLPDVLGRPVRASGTPATRAVQAARRRGAWRLVAVVAVAVLVLGLLLVRADATPRTPAGSAPAAMASSIGRGPAAAGVTALVTAPAGQDPAAWVPADFASVMGYRPKPMRMADGTPRLAKPSGACSVPGGGAPFGFPQACKVHDYGYDLLRYAHATGQQLTPEARRQLDAMFAHDLHARCRAAGHGLARTGCNLVAGLFTAGVSVNSWRQHHGYPARERLPGWALGLTVPVLAGPFLRRLRVRRGARGRRAPGRLRALADATPAGRDRYVDFLRVASIVTVVLGHWTIAAVRRSPDGLVAGNLLSTTPWLWLATWVLQVMPVFFFVGGFANMVSWQALQRRGGGYVEYLSGRMARLVRPVLVLVAVWLVVPPVLGRLGLPAEQVRLVGAVAGQPLWFLGVYLVVVGLAPVMVRLHRRFRLWVPVTLAAVAAVVDALRLAAGLPQVGYLNLLVVWTLAQQVGFFYADGSLTRLSRRALAGLAAAGLGGLVVLTGTGRYPLSMVGLPGEASNMTPPTLCIVALTVWQVALVMLARGRVSAWLAGRGPWTAVVALGSMAMSLYLWHITAMVALDGLVLITGGPLPDPGTAVWWATRPAWLALLTVVLTPAALLLSRLERPGRARRAATAAAGPVETPTGRLAVVLGLSAATLGLLGFTATGFTPLVDPRGHLLLILPVDPLQNLVHLVTGAYLAWVARVGRTDRPLPWLLTAAASTLPLALPGAGPVTIVLHATVAVLALTVAAAAWSGGQTPPAKDRRGHPRRPSGHRRHPARRAGHELPDDQGGGRRGALDEAEEGAEVSGGGEAREVQAGEARPEGLVQRGGAVGHGDPVEDAGEVGDPGQVDTVAGGEDHLVHRQRLAVGQPEPELPAGPDRPRLDDLGPGPAVDGRAGEPGGEPVLQRQPAHLPEPPRDRVLIGPGQPPPPAPNPRRRRHVGIDERPAHPVEPRHVVAVDQVDPLGSVLAQQRRPLIRALSAPHDQDPRARQVLEGDPVAGVGGPVGRDRAGPVRHVGEVADPRRGDHGAGGDPPAALQLGDELAMRHPEVDDQVLERLDALGLAEPLGVVEEQGDGEGVDLRRGDRPLLEVGLQGVDPGRVQVPVGAGAQEHPLGHVLAPEAHRPTHHHGVDAALAGVGGGRQRVGPGPDDQQRRGGRHRIRPPSRLGCRRLSVDSTGGWVEA